MSKVIAHVKVLEAPRHEGDNREPTAPFAFAIEYEAMGYRLPSLETCPHQGPTLEDAEAYALKYAEDRCKLWASTLNNILNAVLQSQNPEPRPHE